MIRDPQTLEALVAETDKIPDHIVRNLVREAVR